MYKEPWPRRASADPCRRAIVGPRGVREVGRWAGRPAPARRVRRPWLVGLIGLARWVLGLIGRRQRDGCVGLGWLGLIGLARWVLGLVGRRQRDGCVGLGWLGLIGLARWVLGLIGGRSATGASPWPGGSGLGWLARAGAADVSGVGDPAAPGAASASPWPGGSGLGWLSGAGAAGVSGVGDPAAPGAAGSGSVAGRAPELFWIDASTAGAAVAGAWPMAARPDSLSRSFSDSANFAAALAWSPLSSRSLASCSATRLGGSAAGVAAGEPDPERTRAMAMSCSTDSARSAVRAGTTFIRWACSALASASLSLPSFISWRDSWTSTS